MEASLKTPRKLDGDKAQRIIAAMRSSVERRGAAAATFDHVASEAGVSRGLLHYYFGSKERLLVEVVRKDCDQSMKRLSEKLAQAESIDEIVAGLVISLNEFIEGDPDAPASALVFEMFTASRHNEELRREMGDLYGRLRDHVAVLLADRERAGVVRLRGGAEAISSILFALGDGIALQRLSDPEWDPSAALAVGIQAAQVLLGADR